MRNQPRGRAFTLMVVSVAIAALASGCTASNHAKTMPRPTPSHAMMSESPSPRMMSPAPSHAVMEPTPQISK
jgi:hypothetical protein